MSPRVALGVLLALLTGGSTAFATGPHRAPDPGPRVAAAESAGRVASDSTLPRITALYQNFPNPFPALGAPATCLWFDLAAPAHVRLEIFDLQWRLVRRLADERMAAGRYGRGAGGGGCDARFTWDGTSDARRVVPPGVYLVRLEADGARSVKKILFRGS